MTRTPSPPGIRSLATLAVSGLLLLTGPAAGTLAQDASAVPEASPDAAVSPLPNTSDVFDPASVQLRADLFVDGLEVPVYITGDGTGSNCLYVVERGGIVRIVGLDGFVRSESLPRPQRPRHRERRAGPALHRLPP